MPRLSTSAACAIVLLTGCAGKVKRIQPAPNLSGVLRASDIYAPGPRTRLFASRTPSGELNRDRLQRRTTSSADSDGRWLLTIDKPTKPSPAANWVPDRQLHLRSAENGAIEMESLVNYDRKTKTVFTPPLLLMPASLEAGHVFTASSKIEVFSVSKPDKIEDRGDAALTAELITRDDSQATLTQTMTFNISLASIVQTREQTISLSGEVPGLVAEVEHLRVKVGIVTVRSDDADWVLVEP